jgi:DNA-binding LytR/AlgR family response regulator
MTSPTTPATTASTALIAEDEPLLAQALQRELQSLWPGLQIVATVGDGAQAVVQAMQHRPQVCFLDIRMPGMSGLEAAQALAEDWPDGVPFPLLVFITAYDQYALQAFEREAVDYLLKPVAPQRLAQCIQRLQRQLSRRGGDAPAMQQAVDQLRSLLGSMTPAPVGSTRLTVIQAGVGQAVHLVPVDDVIYFEAADKYVRVLTAEREHLIRTPLRELMPQLDPQHWWQVHRSLIVQARCITAAVREDSGKLRLSLRGRPETLTASRLYAHLFKGM